MGRGLIHLMIHAQLFLVTLSNIISSPEGTRLSFYRSDDADNNLLISLSTQRSYSVVVITRDFEDKIRFPETQVRTLVRPHLFRNILLFAISSINAFLLSGNDSPTKYGLTSVESGVKTGIVQFETPRPGNFQLDALLLWRDAT